MRKQTIQSILLVLFAGAALAAAPTTAPSSTAVVSSTPTTKPRDVAPVRHGWDYYDVVIQRNVFVKHSPQPSYTSRKEILTPSNFRPSIPSNVWILTGIGIVDNERAAFFENSQTGAAVRMKVGQSVAGGTIKAIEPEGVTIAYDDGSRTVPVGSQTDGREAPSVMPVPGATASTQPSGDGSAAPAGATPAESSLLERMRARRAQEK